MKKLILEFLAAIMLLVGGGTLAAFSGPRMAATTLAVPNFVVPDAYTFVPGSVFDSDSVSGPLNRLSVEVKALLFGATVKLQGSNDNVDWFDLITSTSAGVANAVDVVVVVNVPQLLVLGPNVSGQAGVTARYYRLMAKNTVGASVANVTADYYAE